MHVSVLFGWKCVQHLRRHIDPFISVSDIYAKISVYEIKIGTLNAALILHQQIMVINDSQGELLTTIIQILVRMVILAFYKCVHYTSAKIILVPSASIFVGEWLQSQGHLWAWPLYILFKSDVRHRMHCLVFTDTDLYSLTKGKAYFANQRWRNLRVCEINVMT